MKRVKQTIVFLLLCVLLCFIYTRVMARYFTAEEAFYACERGLRYGPSEEIAAKIPLSDGGTLVLGRLDEGLSAVEVERKFLGLWGLSGGGITGKVWKQPEDELYFQKTDDTLLVGRIANESVTSVYCVVRDYGSGIFLTEFTVPCDEGIFYHRTDAVADYGFKFDVEVYDGEDHSVLLAQEK